MVYEALEPFGDRRGDWQAALVAWAIASINRGKKSKKLEIKDFLLKFQDATERIKQSWQEQRFIGQQWAAIFNSKNENLLITEDKKTGERKTINRDGNV